MRAYLKTHPGYVREINEDTVVASDGLYILADGMGGHQAGEVASSMTAKMLLDALAQRVPDQNILKKEIQNANHMVYLAQKQDMSLSGMGTTLTLLWEDTDCVFVAQVGDSRGYLMRSGKLVQMTEDQSVVGELLRAGAITKEEAANHPYRNVITQAVGSESTVEPAITRCMKMPGDVWLLCSDGLTDMADDEAIAQVMSTSRGYQAADKLIQLALDRGGKDNISVILLEADE